MGDAVLGADPGQKGAIALLCDGRLSLFPQPMAFAKRGKSKKPLTDLPALRDLLCGLQSVYGISHAYIEKVWGVIGQGASTGAALGHHRCALEAACVFSGIPYTLVSPQRWKADMGLFNKPKDAALDLVKGLYPESAEMFKPLRGVRDKEVCIGFADAALIAHHGLTHAHT